MSRLKSFHFFIYCANSPYSKSHCTMFLLGLFCAFYFGCAVREGTHSSGFDDRVRVPCLLCPIFHVNDNGRLGGATEKVFLTVFSEASPSTVECSCRFCFVISCFSAQNCVGRSCLWNAGTKGADFRRPPQQYCTRPLTWALNVR